MQVYEGTLQVSLVRLSPLRIALDSSGRGRIGWGRLTVILQRFSRGERCRATACKSCYLNPGRVWAIPDTIARLHGRRDIVWNCLGRGIICRERVVGLAQTPHASGKTVEQVPGSD